MVHRITSGSCRSLRSLGRSAYGYAPHTLVVMCFRHMSTNFHKAILAAFLCLLSATAIADDEAYTLKRLHAEGWSISEPLLVEEIERKSLNEIKKAIERNKNIPLLPFGLQNDRWLGFKKLMLKGERLYYISSPASDWEQLRGTAGYAIIREGKVVYYFRTMVN